MSLSSKKSFCGRLGAYFNKIFLKFILKFYENPEIPKILADCLENLQRTENQIASKIPKSFQPPEIDFNYHEIAHINPIPTSQMNHRIIKRSILKITQVIYHRIMIFLIWFIRIMRESSNECLKKLFFSWKLFVNLGIRAHGCWLLLEHKLITEWYTENSSINRLNWFIAKISHQNS